MTALWICATPHGDREMFPTEREADARGEWLVSSKTAEMAVTYMVQVEDEGDAA